VFASRRRADVNSAPRPDIGGLFSAKGAFLLLAWGHRPRSRGTQKTR
jgi:hypothetical protein